MKIDVKRFEFGLTYTISKLYIDGEYNCFVLEDKVREIPDSAVKNWKVHGKTAIPKGTYEVKITYSNRFKRYLPEILNVPGYTGVRIHAGNSSEDTEGCLLVGLNWSGGDYVTNSRLAMQSLLTKLITTQEPVLLTIEDVAPEAS